MEIHDLSQADISNLDYECVRLDLHMTSVAIARSVDPEDYIRSVSADIMVYHPGRETFYKAGVIEASIILFDEAAKAGFSHADVLRGASTSQADMYGVVFPDGKVATKIRFGSAALGNNVLMVDLLKVNTLCRGHGIGIVSLRSFLEAFDKHLVVLKAFPLQHGVQSNDEADDNEFEADQYRLIGFYEGLNFKQIGTTEYMFLKTVDGLPLVQHFNDGTISIPFC